MRWVRGAAGWRGGCLPAALVLAACSNAASGTHENAARLEVEWTGADSGKLAGRAVAEWCGAPPMVEIRALQGDSGIAIALYPVDTIRPDSYPVLPPERADSTRPSGAVALRWFAETAVKGFRSDSGSVIVHRSADRRLSGRFSAVLRSASDTSRLQARGTFQGLTVAVPPRGCPPRPAGQPSDTGVH